MNTKVSRIFVWETGARIDLSKVVCIGALDKDEYNNIFLPVYATGLPKPIKFILSNSNGLTPENEKMRVKSIVNHFTNEWETFIYESSSET